MRASFTLARLRRGASCLWVYRRRVVVFMSCAMILGVIAVMLAVEAIEVDAAWLERPEGGTRVVLDRHGALLREVHDDAQRHHQWRALDEISEPMQLATLYAEDRRFYTHVGLDHVAIARSSWINLRAMEVRTGASTITQQTIKLMRERPASESRLQSKLVESALALSLERSSDKHTILTHYLNRAPYGHQRFGVESASRYYFGLSASELGWAHAAFLAGLPRAPSALDPRQGLEPARRVQRQILANLERHGRLSEREYLDALQTPIVLARPSPTHPSLIHPTSHLLAAHPHEDAIHTTLDSRLQRRVHDHLARHVERMRAHDISQAAAIVVETQTGAVLASVGSSDPFDEATLGANDGVYMRRRPGSTLKPFVYGVYLEGGGTLADPIADVPTTLHTELGTWSPRNFDGRFHGPVSVRESLASSLNVPAVLMAHLEGVSAVLERLRALGFGLPGRDQEYGAGIALGNAEVSLFELAQAYAVLGRQGVFRELSRTGEELEEAARHERVVMSEEVAFLLLDALSDDAARRKGFGRGSALEVPFFMAAKTGTSTGYRDTWAVGVTPDYTVAIWAGNFDGSATRQMSGGSGAAPLLRTIMTMLHGERGAVAPLAPETLWRGEVCMHSGQRAGTGCVCPYTFTEWFRRPVRGARGHVDSRGSHHYLRSRQTSCPMHAIGPLGEHVMEVPGTWRQWAASEGLTVRGSGEDLAPEAWLTHPIEGDRYLVHSDHRRAQITLRAAVAPTHEQLWWWVDGAPWKRAEPPYVTTWPALVGAHELGIGTQSVPSHTITIEVLDP